MVKMHRVTLSKYRFERAQEELKTAKELKNSGNMNLSANRSYYAIFYGMLAILSIDGFDSKHHSSVISYFSRSYVRSGIFEADTSAMIWSVFHMRHYADYEDFYKVSPEDAQKQIDKAEKFINMIQPYLDSCWAEMEKKS